VVSSPSSGKKTSFPTLSMEKVQSCWDNLLIATRLRNRPLQALLKDSEPVGIMGQEVFIRFKHSFHKGEVEQISNRQIVEELLGRLVGQSVQVRCVLPDEWKRLEAVIPPGREYPEIIADLQQKLETAVRGLDTTRAQNRTLFEKLDALQQQVRNVSDLKKEQEQLESSIQDLERQRINLELAVQPLEAQQKNVQSVITELEQARIQLQSQNSALRGEHADLVDRQGELRIQIESDERKLKSLHSQQEQLRAQIVQWQSQADDLRHRLEPLEAEVKKYREERVDLQRETQDLKNEIRGQRIGLKKLVAVKAELAKCEAQLGDLQSQIASKEQRLSKLQREQSQREEQLTDLERRMAHMETDLSRLRAQKYGPLWQAVLRTDLDAGELAPYADQILDRLGKADPNKAAAIKLEIAARTDHSELPSRDVEELSETSHLFSGVIRARAAGRRGDLTAAVQMLCDGWEAVLPVGSMPDQKTAPSHESRSVTSPSTEQAPKETPMVRVIRHPVYVTGQWSTLTLKVNSATVLVDPGPDYAVPDSHPYLVVVTHAHDDHVNQLGPLCERFPDLPVVMTPETQDLLDLSLSGWTKIQERQVYCPRLGETQRIEGVKVVLHPAGHLLGAAMAELNIDDIHILVTGDFSLRSVGGLPPVMRPPQGSYDLVLMEAVHASDHNFPSPKPRDNRSEHLVQRVLRAAEQGYTRILITAAALGDAQEVYDALLQGQKDKPTSVLADYTICLKGKAHDVARLYAQTGIWEGSLPDECPSLLAQRTIVIASEGAAEPLRQQFEPLPHAAIFEPSKSAALGLSSERERYYRVDLHASLEELVYFGQHIRCDTIGLYHSHTRGSPLEKQLLSVGKQVINVTAADRMEIRLDGDG